MSKPEVQQASPQPPAKVEVQQRDAIELNLSEFGGSYSEKIKAAIAKHR